MTLTRPRPRYDGRRLARSLLRAPLDYRVVLLTVATSAVATAWATRALGPDVTTTEVDRLGFGLPPLLDGRPWALLSGMFLVEALTLPLPLFTLLGIALYEHVARHWRAAVVLVGGQLAGVLVVCGLLYPLRHGDWAWARDLAGTIDFGMSVGGFATLGAWTAHLPVAWRRRLRVGLSCYFPGPLLFSGLVYDLTHPAGWAIGIGLGAVLASGAPHPADRTPRRPSETIGLVVVAAVGALAGVVLGWGGGGSGGPFGWGPGAG
ncbi:MAG: hypothetical protein GEV08_00450 [Acidimicrobiia bacterium]|nr:hypothetical protein [Acidimicrobiia bacterium]